MPSRRDRIAMSPEEVYAYLSGQSRIILVTNGPGGFPHPVPMNFALDGEGRVLLLSYAASQKVRNLERDPRATLLVESGEAYAELRSVILYARAEIIPPGPAFEEARKAFAGKAQTRVDTAEPGAGAARQAAIDASMAKRVVLRFTPERVVSWDHAKLAGVY